MHTPESGHRSVQLACLKWVKTGRDALEMGCLFFPRKQTSASYAADCDVTVCYGWGKGQSVSALWRGGEVDTIFGFEKEADALQWDQGEVAAVAIGPQMRAYSDQTRVAFALLKRMSLYEIALSSRLL